MSNTLSVEVFNVLEKALKNERLKRTVRIKPYLFILNSSSVKIDVVSFDENAAYLKGNVNPPDESERVTFTATIFYEGDCTLEVFRDGNPISLTVAQRTEFHSITKDLQEWLWKNRLSTVEYEQLELKDCDLNPRLETEMDKFLKKNIVNRFLELRDFESLKSLTETPSSS